MKIYTIEKNIASSIHDISSNLEDREIKFRKGTIYAVVLAAYFGMGNYTTHKSAFAAMRTAKRLDNYSLSIIDSEGNFYFDNQNGSLELIV